MIFLNSNDTFLGLDFAVIIGCLHSLSTWGSLFNIIYLHMALHVNVSARLCTGRLHRLPVYAMPDRWNAPTKTEQMTSVS